MKVAEASKRVPTYRLVDRQVERDEGRVSWPFTSRLELCRFEGQWLAGAFGCVVVRPTAQEALDELARGLAEAGW